ncbi:hypothetical protein B0A49_00592 [Cryomyces minteri]|uniref:MOSC domain-containing protein n=1 Tax=Cryomyces minteri TaxID=331657 RepID=A0A4U0Y0H0_9PEZI|nr:hypothetical protein B0A49_00592 [Cryomyces minteri]
MGLFKMDLIRGTLVLSPPYYLMALCIPLLPIVVLIVLEYVHRREEQVAPAGCRPFGLMADSRLKDQYDKKYEKEGTCGTTPDGSPRAEVKGLFVYPVKSCAPVELQHGEVVSTGLRFDRQFSFAQLVSSKPPVQHRWICVTEREFPRLALVKTQLWVPDPKSPTYSAEGEWVKSGGCIVISFPFSPDWSGGVKAIASSFGAKLRQTSIRAEPQITFRIPFDPPRDRIKEKGYSTERMKIFADEPEALNMSAEIPANILAKLKYTLGVSNTFTLFRVDNEKRRDLFRCAPRKDEIGYQPVYPLHLLNLASVRDVASKLGPTGPRNLDALRFRSNIYITGPAAFAEDSWKRIRIGSGTYHVACRTARCGLPNVDPATGLEPATETAALRVGDAVDVLETGEHWFIAGGVPREEQDRRYYALKEKPRKTAD